MVEHEGIRRGTKTQGKDTTLGPFSGTHTHTTLGPPHRDTLPWETDTLAPSTLRDPHTDTHWPGTSLSQSSDRAGGDGGLE